MTSASLPPLMMSGSVVALAHLPVLDEDAFGAALLAEVAAGGRVAAYFADTAASGNDALDLFAVIARDRQGELRLLRGRVGLRFPSLTPRCPQLHLFEREIAEQFGVVPEGHPWLKPVRFHRSFAPGRDAWNREGRPLIGEMEYYRVEGDEVHEVAVGPVHAGVIEPGHFRFQCHGETVLHLEISLGYQHRGIEQLLRGGPHGLTPCQMETVAGDTTIGHMLAACRLQETLAGIEVSPRARAIRTLALELERLANHVGDIGALAGDVGFLPTASFCGRLRGDYLNMSAAICGSRFGRGLVRPGGVLFDLEADDRQALLVRLAQVERDTMGAIQLFFESPSVLARLEGVGRVTPEDARALGLVGPAARGCGLPLDARQHEPANPPALAAIALAETGDVFARAMVRRLEISASINAVRHLLQNLGEGPIKTVMGPLAPEALAVAITEGWRGEVVHAALTDAAGRFRRYKIVDPSFHNWSGLAMALRNEQISDFPLCNKSFNLSYCGFDL